MTIKNQYKLDVDIKRKYSGVIPTFTKGDTNEVLVTVLDNGDYLDINSVDQVVVTYKNKFGNLTQKNCEILNLIGHRAILINIDKLNIPTGVSELTITLSEGNNQVTLPEIKVVLKEENIKNGDEKVIGTIGGIVVTGYPIRIHIRETVLNKDDAAKLLKSANEVTKSLTKNWSDCIAKIESENPVEIKKDFNIKAIPLQLLTKVNSETSNKEIDSILSTVRSIEHIGFYDTSNEGKELHRIETILENKIIADMNEGNYKSLEHSVRLLQRIKDVYRTVVTTGIIGRSID